MSIKKMDPYKESEEVGAIFYRAIEAQRIYLFSTSHKLNTDYYKTTSGAVFAIFFFKKASTSPKKLLYKSSRS